MKIVKSIICDSNIVLYPWDWAFKALSCTEISECHSLIIVKWKWERKIKKLSLFKVQEKQSNQ